MVTKVNWLKKFIFFSRGCELVRQIQFSILQRMEVHEVEKKKVRAYLKCMFGIVFFFVAIHFFYASHLSAPPAKYAISVRHGVRLRCSALHHIHPSCMNLCLNLNQQLHALQGFHCLALDAMPPHHCLQPY
jgi:hypothetical protein